LSEQQTVPRTPWWKNKKIILRVVVPAVLAVVLIASAYIFHWPGTGFTNFQKTTTTTEVTQSSAKKVTTTVEDQPARTLWDWLQLVGIPVVLAVGTLIFTTRQTRISEANRKQQHDTEIQIAETQQQEELLRTYFDKLSDLLLDKELSSNPNIQSIVRARTLAALHMLNTERKAIVLRFLHDADLLQYVKSFLYSLDLNNADLNGIDLSGANLRGTDLSAANLWYADLSRAHMWLTNLGGAKLLGANLSEADLSAATLSNADLFRANLSHADLSFTLLNEANLKGADLSGTKLNGAYLTNSVLSEANLKGASLHADLRGVDLRGAFVTPEQLEKARNVTSEQLAQIRPSNPAAPQEAKMKQASTTSASLERKPDQPSQEEAEQQEDKQPKQDTDATH